MYWIYHNINRAMGLVSRVFTNGSGDCGSIPGRVISKTQKMVLDATLLNTQHYKVRIKGSGAIQGMKLWSPLYIGVVAIEKGALMSPSTKIANFTCLGKVVASALTPWYSSYWKGSLWWRCPWCNGYHHRKWTQQHKFKFWTRLIAFHIALIPWERYESNYSPSSYGQIVGQTGFFSFSEQIV